MTIGPDIGLTNALAAVVTTTHEEVPLAQLTDWQWDELIIFVEGARASDINAAAGQEVMHDKYLYNRTLLLFMDGGSFARGVTTYIGFSFAPDDTRQFTNEVRVVPVQSNSGGWNLRLLEPGDNQ